MSSRKRDEFLQKVKNVLFQRVNGHCSNPSCRVATSGPNSNPEKATSIGVAAHITAAAEGGPRFDAGLSKAERKSINNAIWLCQSCSKLIDSDVSIYSAETLRDWKSRGESKAARDIGQSPVEMLMTKAQGLRAIIHSFLSAEKDRIESLDKRIALTPIYDGRDLKYVISAKENFSTQITLKSSSDNLLEKMKLNYEEGVSVQIKFDELRWEGSRALEELSKNASSGEITFGSREVDCQVSVQSTSKNNHSVSYLSRGKIIFGTKKIRYRSEDTNSPITINMEVGRNDNIATIEKLDFGPDFGKFEGHKLESLPGLGYINDLFGELSSGLVDLEFFVNGKRFLKVNLKQKPNTENVRRVKNLISFINKCVTVARHYKINPVFTGIHSLSADALERIDLVYDLIHAGYRDVSGDGIRIQANMSLTSDGFESFKTERAKKKLMEIRIVENESTFDLFGESVRTKNISYKASKMKYVSDTNFKKLKPGEVIEGEWIGGKRSRCRISFDVDAAK